MPISPIKGSSTASVVPKSKDGIPSANVESGRESSTGWAPKNGTSKSVVPSAGNLTHSDADIRATMPNPVKAQLETALATFHSRVEMGLGHDAMSIARGKPGAIEGQPLTAAQNTELQNASTDFLKSIPLGALDAEVVSRIQSKLESAGINTRDLSGTKLGDLGKIGGDIAKELVSDLKENSPAAYYSLAAGLAAAAGLVAYQGGSAKLAKFGIKPEVKAGFFDDKLQVKLRGDWDAHFKNFKATATITGRVDIGPGQTISGSITGNSATGLDGARIQYDLNRTDLNLSVYGTTNRSGIEDVGATATYRPNNNLTLSGGINHNFQTDRTTATAEASWKIKNNIDLGLSASHDSQGDSRIGAGLRIRF